MVYVFLADGFEEIEAIAPIDILRRCAINVVSVSLNDTNEVCGTHKIKFIADTTIACCNFDDAKAIVLPGGLPGADNLENNEILIKEIKKAADSGKIVAAICAAPKILGKMGLTNGKNATCYPGFENELVGAKYTDCKVVQDENIITACGPGAAFDFAFKLCEALGYSAEAEKVKKGMLV